MGLKTLVRNAVENYRLSRVDAKTLGPMYRSMHQEAKFPGTTWKRNLDDLRDSVPALDDKVILDFGCGPNGGVAESFSNAIAFDPYVDTYRQNPWQQSFDVVHSSDVLEHMPQTEIQQLCENIRNSTANHAFLVISTRPAVKLLPNGMNAHVTVKPAQWWVAYLSKHLGTDFRLTLGKADLVAMQVIVCFERTQSQIAKLAA